jgi:sulfotransferase famil protein
LRFSQEHKFIFIASPKTGTSSVHKFLDDNFTGLEKWCAIRNGEQVKVRGHSTAREIKFILQNEYNNYKTFAFVRNPYAKLVSGYFFYKKGGKVSIMNKKYSIKNIIIEKAKSIIANVLPFKIWSVLYPYKSNFEYITDNNGRIIVDYIGRTEFLEVDLNIILKLIGIKKEEVIFPKLNSSGSRDFEKYFRSKWHKKLIDFKIRKDIKINSIIEEGFGINKL